MVKKNIPKIVIVGKLYWKECGHCKALVPEWKKMKSYIRRISKTNPNISYRFVEILSGDTEKDQIDKINERYLNNSENKLAVQGGYPTIFKIKDNNLSYFEGGSRTAPELQKWYLQDKVGGNNIENNSKLEKQPDDFSEHSSDDGVSMLTKIRNFFGGKKTYKKHSLENTKTQKYKK